MGILTIASHIDRTAPPADPVSLIAVFSLPTIWIGGILWVRHVQRRRHR